MELENRLQQIEFVIMRSVQAFDDLKGMLSCQENEIEKQIMFSRQGMHLYLYTTYFVVIEISKLFHRPNGSSNIASLHGFINHFNLERPSTLKMDEAIGIVETVFNNKEHVFLLALRDQTYAHLDGKTANNTGAIPLLGFTELNSIQALMRKIEKIYNLFFEALFDKEINIIFEAFEKPEMEVFFKEIALYQEYYFEHFVQAEIWKQQKK